MQSGYKSFSHQPQFVAALSRFYFLKLSCPYSSLTYSYNVGGGGWLVCAWDVLVVHVYMSVWSLFTYSSRGACLSGKGEGWGQISYPLLLIKGHSQITFAIVTTYLKVWVSFRNWIWRNLECPKGTRYLELPWYWVPKKGILWHCSIKLKSF